LDEFNNVYELEVEGVGDYWSLGQQVFVRWFVEFVWEAGLGVLL
jgi:hypothetical protein